MTSRSRTRRSAARFERRSEPLLPGRQFALRLLRHGGLAAALLVSSLALGAAGYHETAGLSWLDAFLNASMILSGMGPVDPLRQAEAKLFATCYALFSGIVFLAVAGLLLGPLLHRLLHRFHLDEQDGGG